MDRTQRMTGRGCGKLILFGEHAVVHGYPAIVAGLPRGANASISAGTEHKLTLVNGRTGEKLANAKPGDGSKLGQAFEAILTPFHMALPVEVNVTIDIPIGAGLGSSAAMATAAARAVATFAGMADELTAVEQAVSASESVFHGNPSGIDQAAALGGGVFRFRRDADGQQIEALWVNPVRIAVCQAGPAADTGKMVAKVGDLLNRRPKTVRSLFALIGELADEGAPALASGDWGAVGDLINMNHGALVGLGVSSPEIDAACHAARDAGAFGAKLTGAGGGGCVIALSGNSTDDVISSWNECGFDGFEITIP